MDLLLQLVQFVLHLDVHLTELVARYGVLIYVILLAIVFCETGLVVTPFLPGDSLLFLTGAIAAGMDSVNIPLLLALLIVAAVLGDAVNYAVGYRLGPKVFKYEQSWFFNKRHLLRAQ